MKRVIITGPTGTIGRALIRAAIDAGYEVLAVVHRSSERASELDDIEHCRVLRLDLSEYGAAKAELEWFGLPTQGYDIFFHMAWSATYGEERNHLNLQLDNIRGALRAVELARAVGCHTFVGVGSQAEYGRVEEALRADTPANPENGYGIAKLTAGFMTRLAAQKAGMRHIWDRVLSVYGPYDNERTLISTALNRMSENQETEFTPCQQIWDYLYADDAARAILLTGEKGTDGKCYVIGSGEGHPLRWYVDKIAELTGYTQEIGYGKRPYPDKQVMHLVADITSLTEDTGFEPRVSFEEGIKALIEHRRKALEPPVEEPDEEDGSGFFL